MAESKDSEERRNEFVDAAEKLFKENGIVDTTINSIVKEMNVAKGLFYYYFKSKDDVIDAISDKYNEVFNEMMHASMDKPTYEERLEQFIDNCIVSFRELYEKLEGDDVDLMQLSSKSIEEAKNATIDGLEKLLHEGVENGAYQFTNTRFYADIIVGGMMTILREKDACNEDIKNIILDLIHKSGKE